jgi:hypothetical protein
MIGWLRRLLSFKCPFQGKCSLYYKEAYTCNNGGGLYCGKYKEFEKG